MARVFSALLVVQLAGWSQAAKWKFSSAVPPIGQTSVVYDTDVDPPALYWEVNATLLEMMQAQWPANSNFATFLFRMEVPEKAKEMTIYDFLMVSFNPFGHPGWDARQFASPMEMPGGYGDSHFDVHFYIDKTIAWAQQELNGCVGPAPGVCFQAAISPPGTPSNAKTVQFQTLPSDAGLYAGYAVDGAFGGAAVEEHGNHLMPTAQMYVDEYTCTSTGPNAGPMGWLDCIAQANAFAPPTWGQFVDMNCTCPQWTMPHPVLLTYDGEVIAHEIMPSIKHYMMMKSGAASNPWIQDYPQPTMFAHDDTAWKRAEKLFSHYDATAGVMRWGLQMHAGAPAEMLQPSSKASGCTSTVLGSILAIAAVALASKTR